jgi:hypothetical protein
MGKYLDLLIARPEPMQCDKSDKSDQSLPFGRLSRFGRILEELERRCPDHVDPADWELASRTVGRFCPYGVSKPKRWGGRPPICSDWPQSPSDRSPTTIAFPGTT